MTDIIVKNATYEGFPSKEEMMEPTARGLSLISRYVFGYNYWLDGKNRRMTTGQWIWEGEKHSTAGLVDWGPLRIMMDGFVNPSRLDVLMMMSRGTLKTTCGQAWLAQEILRNPNITGLVYMDTDKLANDTVRSIREMLESEVVTYFWGLQKGEPWSDSSFRVRGNTDLGNKNNTLISGGTNSKTVGKHFDIVWIDDPVDWKQALSDQQMQKAIRGFEQIGPQINNGGRTRVTMTPYAEGDLSFYIRNAPDNGFHSIVLPCGMRAVSNGKGGHKLEGDPYFPHLDRENLQRRFQRMNNPALFNSQYALDVVSPDDQFFFRETFEEVPFRDAMRSMSCYILCDTSASKDPSACYGVMALVALDHNDIAFILDMKVGRFEPGDYVDTLLNFAQDWGSRVRIVGVSMETVTMNHVYKAFIDRECQRRNMRLTLLPVSRGIADGKKHQRIGSLQARMRQGGIKIVETISRTYNDRSEEKILWDPKGFDGGDRLLPSGELVDQFLRFRGGSIKQSGRIDIPDALADLHAIGKDGLRVIKPSPRPWRAEPSGETTHQFNLLDRERKAEITRMTSRGRSGARNWWDRVSAQVRKGR